MKGAHLYTVLYGHPYLQEASALRLAVAPVQASPNCISGPDSLSGSK